MKLFRTDPRITTALQNWAEIAPSLGLSAGDFRHRLIWQKDQSDRNHIVLRLKSAKRSLVLKQVFVGIDPKDQVAAIIAQKKAATALAPDDRAHVPEILYASEDGRLVVMEAITGDFADLHLEMGKNPDRVLQDVAAWLDAYHRATEDSRRIYRPEFMVRHVGRLAEAVEQGAPVPEPDLFQAAAGRIAGIAEGFEGRKTVSAATHGDFNLRNVILNDRGATVFDFSPDATAPVGFDIARLLADYAELYQPIAKVPRGQILAPETLAAFFKTYQLVGPDDPSVGFLPFVRVLNDWRFIPNKASRRNRRQEKRLRGILALVQNGFGL